MSKTNFWRKNIQRKWKSLFSLFFNSHHPYWTKTIKTQKLLQKYYCKNAMVFSWKNLSISKLVLGKCPFVIMPHNLFWKDFYRIRKEKVIKVFSLSLLVITCHKVTLLLFDAFKWQLTLFHSLHKQVLSCNRWCLGPFHIIDVAE